jgi:hypothetical protein
MILGSLAMATKGGSAPISTIIAACSRVLANFRRQPAARNLSEYRCCMCKCVRICLYMLYTDILCVGVCEVFHVVLCIDILCVIVCAFLYVCVRMHACMYTILLGSENSSHSHKYTHAQVHTNTHTQTDTGTCNHYLAWRGANCACGLICMCTHACMYIHNTHTQTGAGTSM